MVLSEMQLQNQDVFDKTFARRVALMIEARLIDYRYYYHWADEIIMAMEEPPSWILEIATIKYFPDALKVVNEFVYAEPFESFDSQQYGDEYIACLFIRYKRGELPWATFLQEAGRFTDRMRGYNHCENLYLLLSHLEDWGYSENIEHSQRAEIEPAYAGAIEPIEALYNGFLEHFHLYTASKP